MSTTVNVRSGFQFTSSPLFTTSGSHSLLVHTAAKGFNVITDIGDHTVPFVTLGGLLALVRGRAVAASSCCSVAVGGGIGGGAGRTSVTAEAVGDDTSAVFDADGLEEILKVLAVLLWYEGSQACRGQGKKFLLFLKV